MNRSWIGIIVRFVVSAIVLMLVAYLIPGIKVSGFVGALIAALVIAGIGYLIEMAFGDRISPRSRGIVGFITAARYSPIEAIGLPVTSL
jgi:putative membrane protein